MEESPVVVIGCGPAGMAATLGMIKAGHDVKLYERYSQARPAGNILNLWAPAVRALLELGVDIKDIGASCETGFYNLQGDRRCVFRMPETQYGTGFIGLLRPDLFSRMLDVIPDDTIRWGHEVESIEDHDEKVIIHFTNGHVVSTQLLIGADGIDSAVRAHLWGAKEKRSHHVMVSGGYTFAQLPTLRPNHVMVHHGKDVQATYSSIKSKSKPGNQWWIVEAWPEERSAPNSHDLYKQCSAHVQNFPQCMQDVVAATSPENVVAWKIRDRVPLTKWSKGRITLSGDAAHPISPYAAYGAGMSICDGWFLGKLLTGVDLEDTAAIERALEQYDALRIPHTSEQVQLAYYLGTLFHHTPWYLQWLRDLVMDRTPLLQWVIGDRNPAQIMAQLDEMDRLC